MKHLNSSLPFHNFSDNFRIIESLLIVTQALGQFPSTKEQAFSLMHPSSTKVQNAHHCSHDLPHQTRSPSFTPCLPKLVSPGIWHKCSYSFLTYLFSLSPTSYLLLGAPYFSFETPHVFGFISSYLLRV